MFQTPHFLLYRYVRAFSPGVQEYIEAASFYEYLRTGTLISKAKLEADVQTASPTVWEKRRVKGKEKRKEKKGLREKREEKRTWPERSEERKNREEKKGREKEEEEME